MGILLLAGIGLLVIYFVILHWLFIEGSIMLIKGIPALSFYVRTIRKQKRRVQGLIALPIIFIVLGTIAVTPLSVTLVVGMDACLKNEIAQHDTGISVDLKRGDDTFQLKGKTYEKLDDYLESAGIMFDNNIGADQAVANLVVPVTEDASLLGPYFSLLTHTYPEAYRLYQSSEAENSNILFDDYTNSYWCEKSYLSKAVSYYGRAENYEYYLFPEDDKEHAKEKKDEFKKVSSRITRVFDLLTELDSYDSSNLPPKAITLNDEEASIWTWGIRSKDGVIYGLPSRSYSMDFVIQDNSVYYVFHQNDDSLYCYPIDIKLD